MHNQNFKQLMELVLQVFEFQTNKELSIPSKNDVKDIPYFHDESVNMKSSCVH